MQAQAFITTETRYHQKIRLNPQDFIGQAIIRDGIYDKTGLYFIEKILAKLNADVIFDIGASIGNHALRMSHYCKKLYLFEPQIILAENLKQTASLNQLSHWQIFNMGLSNENQKLTFYRNIDSNIESSFVPTLKGDNFVEEEATVYVGDEIVHKNAIEQIDFMKIDVEGFEAKVILGLKESIQKFRPVIFMEWDKQITRDQFQTFEIFHTIFSDYDIKAIIRNPAESSLLKKAAGKFNRLFSPGTKRQRWIIGKFQPARDYRHIVLVPVEKSYVLDD